MKRFVPIFLAVSVLAWVSAAPADDPEVPEKYLKVDEAKALLDQKKRLVFIDVRPKEQFDELHIRGALNIPLSQLQRRIAEVPKQHPVILY